MPDTDTPLHLRRGVRHLMTTPNWPKHILNSGYVEVLAFVAHGWFWHTISGSPPPMPFHCLEQDAHSLIELAARHAIEDGDYGLRLFKDYDIDPDTKTATFAGWTILTRGGDLAGYKNYDGIHPTRLDAILAAYEAVVMPKERPHA